MKKLILNSIFLLLVLISSCKKNSDNNPIITNIKYYTINVTVIDKDKNLLLSNVDVSITSLINNKLNKIKRTNSNGLVIFDSLPEDQYLAIALTNAVYLFHSSTLWVNDSSQKNITLNVSNGYFNITENGTTKTYLANELSEFSSEIIPSQPMPPNQPPTFWGTLSFKTKDGWYGNFGETVSGSNYDINHLIINDKIKILGKGTDSVSSGSYYVKIYFNELEGNFNAIMKSGTIVGGDFHMLKIN